MFFPQSPTLVAFSGIFLLLGSGIDLLGSRFDGYCRPPGLPEIQKISKSETRALRSTSTEFVFNLKRCGSQPFEKVRERERGLVWRKNRKWVFLWRFWEWCLGEGPYVAIRTNVKVYESWVVWCEVYSLGNPILKLASVCCFRSSMLGGLVWWVSCLSDPNCRQR